MLHSSFCRRILCAQAFVLISLICHSAVRPGIEVLEGRGFEGLVGKKVGLLTNPSGVDRNLRSTIDILNEAPEVNLVKLFAPEHGVRGDIYAGGKVTDSVDPKTGIPVYSLYGRTRMPSDEMLSGLSGDEPERAKVTPGLKNELDNTKAEEAQKEMKATESAVYAENTERQQQDVSREMKNA